MAAPSTPPTSAPSQHPAAPQVTGRLLRSGGALSLEMDRTLPVPVTGAWAHLTEPALLARWIGTWDPRPGQGAPRAGSTVLFSMSAEEDAGGPAAELLVRECEPPQRLAVDLRGGDPAWQLALTLRPSTTAGTGAGSATGSGAGGAATALTFSQLLRGPDGTGPAPGAADVGPLAAGWEWYLDRLVAVLAGAPAPDWEDYWPALAEPYEHLAAGAGGGR